MTVGGKYPVRVERRKGRPSVWIAPGLVRATERHTDVLDRLRDVHSVPRRP